jgi:threonine aldolase
MRQAGVLAACGLIALEKMSGRLAEDHENARFLGDRLAGIQGIRVNRERIRINMVFWEPEIPGFDGEAFVRFMLKRGIKISDGPEYRFVTHNDVSREDIGAVISALRDYIGSLAN